MASKHRMVLVLLMGLLFTNSCRKPVQPIAAPIDITVDNTWECRVDGILYKGSIDTAIVRIAPMSPTMADTTLICSGTSADKKANIYFKLLVNRTAMRSTTLTTNSSYNAAFAFDTSALNFLQPLSSITEIVFNLDTLINNKLKGSFSGSLSDFSIVSGGPAHTVTDGKFNFEFGTGNNYPKTFSFTADSKPVIGSIKYARLASNTLIIDGYPFSISNQENFRLMVRTGSSIKPGTYESVNGDACLQYYVPSYYPFYINDQQGNLSVTINSVQGNVVLGSFSGVHSDGKTVQSGKFHCVVKDYQPSLDALNKWKFGEDEYVYKNNLYGGNVLNAFMNQSAGKYYLNVNGESDNGQSKFKITISSLSPITPGIYQSATFGNRLDSFYFISPAKAWIQMSTSISFSPVGYTYCKIDTIDAFKVLVLFTEK